MEQQNNVTIHRVGSITLGVALIVFGCLFLFHMIVPVISYDFIFHLWPLILIILGIEILASNLARGNHKFIYDYGAIAILIFLACFAFLMAISDYYMHEAYYLYMK